MGKGVWGGDCEEKDVGRGLWRKGYGEGIVGKGMGCVWGWVGGGGGGVLIKT